MKRVSTVTAPVAQRIVDRTMQQLGHNVNVMDDEGVIVGTGDPSRRGEVHEGALLAIRGRRTVVVDEEMGRRLSGARPGVNLPLVVDGEVVGAVGVSGDPADVEQVADLLRLTAELMIEQAAAIDEDEWRSSRLDALVQLMIASEPEPARTAAVAAELGVDLTVERFVVLVVPRTSRDAGTLRDVRRTLHRGRTDVLTLRSERDEVVVLVPVGTAVPDLVRDLGPLRHRVTLAVGGRFEGSTLFASCATARDVLASAGDTGAEIVSFEDDRFTALVAGLGGGWRTEALAAPWQRLVAADRLVADTVVAYWQSGADLGRCAAALRVHRNTLRNRLDRVETLSGADIRDSRGSSELMIGAIMSGDLCMRTDRGGKTG